ncbi:MAG TPA: FAD-dependent oxidoreductase [Thermomicrobiaceae bacterium]|nr:FAD-dependent oxidoreductase [Thermomicrobiaceae bacterium]
MEQEQAYHYVVIGAGATGSVVAARLSADPKTRVLLLEAGPPDTNPAIDDIGGFVSLWGSDIDWKLMTVDQPAQGDRQILINQGKTLGGGTAINAMMWVHGNRRNFDHWAERGADGWSFADVLPYFRKVENFEGGASEFHGVGGPVSIRPNPDPNSPAEAFRVGATELGYDGPDWDYNGERQENGAGLLQFNITPDGQRASAARSYLYSIRDRANLRIETDAPVTRILFEGSRATGVEYMGAGQRRTARAEREVIVCAGAFFSPQLLMLSGIGPADHLRSHGIDVVADLPGVGQNLQDHLQLPIVYAAKAERPQPKLLTGEVLFLRTRQGSTDIGPDLQLNFTPAVPAPLAPVLNIPIPVCIFLPIMVNPESSGEVRLRSADPLDPPIVNPRYLQAEADYQTFISAIQIIRDLAKTKAFSAEYAGEVAPGDADLDAYIRSQTSTLWHPAGTCAMGNDERAVVDPQLRVRGVDGLRVADASVMPTVTTGNTQAACFMIGEKLAAMMLGETA